MLLKTIASPPIIMPIVNALSGFIASFMLSPKFLLFSTTSLFIAFANCFLGFIMVFIQSPSTLIPIMKIAVKVTPTPIFAALFLISLAKRLKFCSMISSPSACPNVNIRPARQHWNIPENHVLGLVNDLSVPSTSSLTIISLLVWASSLFLSLMNSFSSLLI